MHIISSFIFDFSIASSSLVNGSACVPNVTNINILHLHIQLLDIFLTILPIVQ